MSNQLLLFIYITGVNYFIERMITIPTKIKIDFDKIYQSNNFGEYKIIKEVEKNGKYRMVLIEFIRTGFRKVTRLDAAINGTVKDDTFGIDFNKIYYSNMYGPFIILKLAGRNNEGKRLVLIKFLNTGNEKVVLLKTAVMGYAVDDNAEKDPLNPNVLDNHNEYIIKLLNGVWKRMISRCYNQNDIQYKFYGGIGITVSDEWKDKNIFIDTVTLIPQFDKYYNNPYGYQLDKDYLQQNIPKCNRIYSKETCMFLSNQDNKNLSIIERNINSYNGNKYYGVRVENCGTFRVEMHINGKYTNIGTFSDIIAAANAFNYFQMLYHEYELVPLVNDVPYMTPYEFFSYKIGRKTMVDIIK